MQCKFFCCGRWTDTPVNCTIDAGDSLISQPTGYNILPAGNGGKTKCLVQWRSEGTKMTIYLNEGDLPLILPYDCLEALGRPRFIQVLIDEKRRRIAILALEKESPDMFFDLHEVHYREKRPLVIYGYEFVVLLRQMMGWDRDIAYEVDYSSKTRPDGARLLEADLNTAREATQLPKEPYMFCGWQQNAALADGIEVVGLLSVRSDGTPYWKNRMSAEQFRHYNERRRRR